VRPFTSIITLDEARRRLADAVRPIARTERLDLGGARGRVAAEDVRSALDVPPFSRSAMDGYAVISSDTAGATSAAPRTLRIVDRIYSGQPSPVTITPGACAEIATGAPLPAGADAVIAVEETTPGDDPDAVRICASVAGGQHVSPIGADIVRGSTVVRAGEVLMPGRLGALAATGATTVTAFERPRVAILSTGNEIVEPGATPAPGQIYDVNRFTLGAVVSAHGGLPEFHRPAGDTIESLNEAFDRSAGADLIVFSGGSSVGERDLLVDVLRDRGEMVFHGVAIKPGKPTAFARVGGAAFFGMPGNPTSCLSNAYVLLVPFLRATARLPAHVPPTVRVPLAKTVRSTRDRHQFYPVRVERGLAHPVFKGSGDITSLSRADGYIEIAAGSSDLQEGTVVDVIRFE
jgi:molybdopterin molybdotransferase